MCPEDKSHPWAWQAGFSDTGGHSGGAHESPLCPFTIPVGRQPSSSLASKLKLALNLRKGAEPCRGPSLWRIYSLKLTEVACWEQLKISHQNRFQHSGELVPRGSVAPAALFENERNKSNPEANETFSTASSKAVENHLFIKGQRWFSLPCR